MQRITHRQLLKIKQHLKNGGIIAYPTESCYGFGCNPQNYKAIDQIIRLKQRSKNKGMIAIGGNIKHFKHLLAPISVNDQIELCKYWPGFYSVVLPAKKNTHRNLTGIHNKLAVRVSKHTLVKQLTDYLGYAIVSTSANKSGKKSITTFRECKKRFGRKVLVIRGNTLFAKRPSTIIDWTTGKILR